MSLSRPAEAQSQAALVLADQPENAQAWLIEGRALLALNQTNAARTAFETAIRLDDGGQAAAAAAYLAILEQSGNPPAD